MKTQSFLLMFLLLLYNISYSQVKIVLKQIPVNTPENSKIYIAGNFNEWNPGNEKYELKKDANNSYSISFDTNLSEIEYKFTLGSWELEESAKDGLTIQNRKSKIEQEETIFAEIEAWKTGIKKHTTSPNVHILKDDFYMPQLNRKRRIWIYLPPDYYNSKHSYPVFYAHDGQNLFDAATSFSGEWAVDEILDSLYLKNIKTCIVVGIDNGGEYRTEELTPWPNPKHGGGNAALYSEFIVKTLKPHIDSTFRTLRDRKNTGVLGSSLGGLVSFYMAFHYPEVFGKAGVFSPSFWFSEQVYQMAENIQHKNMPKIYILAGGNEDENMEKEIVKMKQVLVKKGFNKKYLKVNIVPEGQHNEWFWRREFPKVYQWLCE